MAYTPTNWQTGDTITAEKLNNMEGGITSVNGSIPYTIDEVEGTVTLGKTFNEIVAMIGNGVVPFLAVSGQDGETRETDIYTLAICGESGGGCSLTFSFYTQGAYDTMNFLAESKDSYPHSVAQQ